MAKFIGKTLRDDILNWLKGTAFPATLANTYVAALTTAPTAIDGTGAVEVSTSGTAYARQAVASSGWSAISASGSGLSALEVISNSALIAFAQATANWGTVVGLALYDASTAGNLLAYGDLTTSVAVNSGDTLQVPIGDLINQQ